jgi:hypothetical protein
VSARRRNGRSGRRRRAIALALGAILAAAAALGGGLIRRGRGERQRRAEQAESARAQAESRRAAADGQRALQARELGRLRGPPSRVGELLAALARATPPAIVLREVTCREDSFVIRGHLEGAVESAGALLLHFRRELGPAEAPWQISEAPAGPAEFTWSGTFARPAIPATEALGPTLAAARAALRPAAAFDAWLQGWGPCWKVRAHSSEREPGLEVRHYALAYEPAPLGAWSDIVRTLQALAAEPGLSVDRLVLAAAPDGADAFTQAQLTLTARLRP